MAVDCNEVTAMVTGPLVMLTWGLLIVAFLAAVFGSLRSTGLAPEGRTSG